MNKRILIVLSITMGIVLGGVFMLKGSDLFSSPQKSKSSFGNTDLNPNVHPELKKEEPKKEAKETTEQIKNRVIKNAKTPRFHELKKNPLKYKDTYVIYTGGVAQAYEREKGTFLLLGMSDRGVDYLAVYLPCYAHTDAVEGDIVKVYGRISQDGFCDIGTKDKPHEVPWVLSSVVEKIKNGGTVTWK